MKKITLLLASWLLFLTGCTHVQQGPRRMKAGTIIVLNGPSAAGKSSIQKAFQYLKMPNLWVKVGIDNLFDFPMPDITLENMSFWQKENEILWVVKGADAEGSTTVTLHVGNQGTRVAYAMNSAIADYASNGCDVIVDYIAYKKEWLDDLQQKLKSYEVYYVAVDISLEELERREAARETSPVGHARSHYGEVHWDRVYDLRVNTELASPEVIAKKIADYIAKKKNY